MSSLDVLVLGGTLYFGRAAVEELLEAGHRVTVFSRGRLRPPFWDSVEHIEGDRTDADGLVERLGGRTFDGVIDNICYNRGEAESVVRALRGRVGRYVVASTVSVYGEAGHAIHRHTPTRPLSDEARFAVDYRPLEPVREEDLDNSTHPWEYREGLEEYAEGKRHMERVMLESAADWPWVVVRVPSTVGPGDPSGRFAFWLTRLLDGGPMLLPDGGVHATQLGYSRDLAHFLVRLLEAGPPRTTYNYAQRETPSLLSWLHAMAGAAGESLEALPVPSTLLHRHTDLPWKDWSYAPFSSTPVLMSLDRAQREIGLDYRASLEEWMQATVDWYLEDRQRLSVARHGEHRVAELAIAERWQRLDADPGSLFTG